MKYLRLAVKYIFFFLVVPTLACVHSDTVAQTNEDTPLLKINDEGYYETGGLDVMVFDDFYPEGHQGGLTIVQCGKRLAANGDVRLEPTPGQWSPVPKVGERHIDKLHNSISVTLWYPDSSQDRKGFNPIIYPDLRFYYTIRTEAVGNTIKVDVDLDAPLPKEWANRVGFNLEFFPGEYFGEYYLMDGVSGAFPRQADGPMVTDDRGNLQIAPMAQGKKLIVAPDSPQKEIEIVSNTSPLQLYDGRGLHNNGWFVLRSTIPAGAVKGAVEWIISPRVNSSWKYKPVVQVSQVGYHPKQKKFAVIELDKRDTSYDRIQLVRIDENSENVVKADSSPKLWGHFLRYSYLRFDFSNVTEEGLYKVRYGSTESNVFEIKNNVFAKNVWQPTLDYFLVVQMCHMRVEDRYRVWHGLCHMDDATMAPVNHNHFDGYFQRGSTLTKYKPGEHVPGLNIGGWHDAGDYDLRVESQAETVYKLVLAYEFFVKDYDQTSIDEETRVARIHVPDGKPDILQQVEHGVLSIIGGYESMGRLYRGIICPTLKQYVHLGDASTISDNLIYKEGAIDPILHRPLPQDDGMVFTEENPPRELYVAQTLAAASRVLKGFDNDLATKCLSVSEALYAKDISASAKDKINTAAELYLTTSDEIYKKVLLENENLISSDVEFSAEVLGRVVKKIGDPGFTAKIEEGVKAAAKRIVEQQKENPYGVPYKPYIWGAGWGIQSFGVKQLFLHLGFPNIVSSEYAFNAMNFVLGCHPGENTASFASGVGVRSLTVAYGANRADWTYIPGGVGSGTALIRPDLPELKTWPYFWQQTEYVMGGGATDFMLLAMAADHLFNE
ncbi:MAG TPA: glycoside hydrolase family 9 protein [Bacteroidota bacterium]|nr:glycoside hydrolase family 9 protein [Bacteroidota bacterium]